jgi:hypothetical protein
MSPLAINPNNFWCWFGGIWFFCGLPFLSIGLYAGIEQVLVSKRLNVEGRSVEGMVLSKTVRSSSSSGSGRKNHSPTYEVTFRFLTPGGMVNGTTKVTSATWDRLIERKPIAITYLPEDPQRYRVEGQTSGWVLPVMFTVIGGLFTVAGGFIWLRSKRQSRTTERLKREGMSAEGVVVEVRAGMIRINRVQQMNLHYRYQDHRGKFHIGKIPLSPKEAECWKEGDTGRVRYDRLRPQKSIWIGKA